MKILGIETSCDDTGVAVIDDSKPLSNVVSSQAKLHAKYGGVYPSLAKREHQKNLVFVLIKALKKAGLLKKQKTLVDEKTIQNILVREPELSKGTIRFLEEYRKPALSAIAVTIGPGLEPCLWAGVNFAKALAFAWNLPIIPVNHIKAHLFSNNIKKNDLPAVCLIVSGGHTQLILMKSFGEYRILGETRDDAAGECFDKTARILGLKYPGGPEISKLAGLFKGKKTISLPRPMINSKDYDFSFSGLKTAVLYHPAKDKVKEMAHEIQEAIIDVLIKKTEKAVKEFSAKSIVAGGGVTANRELRKRLKRQKVKVYLPDIKLSTDNALMIAEAARYGTKKNWEDIEVKANLRIE
ncbi:tRNA (adenosine(37)-N6)-threonylcarbamoyltransferase complex transferase subunit TsaD [Patescibacteria group bacterium]|nr:tRNA (adenosine(37)-N6)-threonylcarbamoyltransferase complex transferase subunit TsaD [Patescibacteria group bacterium]